jgi:hypothetical protein
MAALGMPKPSTVQENIERRWYCLDPAEQLRQLGDVHRYPSRLDLTFCSKVLGF